MADGVTYSVVGQVATVTLARPGQRNVLDGQVLSLLREFGRAATDDDGVRVLVLAAEGTVFCAGADLSAVAAGDAESFAGSGSEQLAAMLDEWTDIPKPVVACVQGAVAGGGIGLLAVCDVVVASTDASFAFREVRVGVAPAVVAVPLTGRLAPGVVRDLMLSGRRIDALEAHAAGLVHRVTAPDRLDATTRSVVQELVSGGAQAQAATKALLNELPGLSKQAAYARAAQVSAERFASDEAREGIAAFKQKRAPSW
ncbi:MAG TPA: enoyl-CoA hydratase-related protein [Actinomycetes bacterium]|nr:enoyl-CoA hydratase-related protein [Actinomycetes bacterium]